MRAVMEDGKILRLAVDVMVSEWNQTKKTVSVQASVTLYYTQTYTHISKH